MPLPTAADCWPVVADRRPSPLAPRCRPPWRAGHLSEVRGAKITAFSVPTNFSLRNLSPARRVITAEGSSPPKEPPPGSPQNRRTPAAAEALSPEGGITVEWPAARKPAESPHSRCRGGIVARRGHHRRMARRPEARRIAALPLPRRHHARRGITAEGTARPQVLRPEEHRTSAADRRNCQTVEVARYRVSPSKLPAIASARRGGTLSQRPVASARYRSRPSNRWLKSSCGAGL